MTRIFFKMIFAAVPVRAHAPVHQQRLQPAQIVKIKQAILDEIYDYGLNKDFYQMGDNVGVPQHWLARMHLYINPIYSADRGGAVIYKLMPYGQIYRVFDIDKGGDVTLDGDPGNHFPQTQPSYQTVFMDEGDLGRLERAWLKSSFVVDAEPTDDIIRGAALRQKARTGFSDSEYRGSGNSAKKTPR
jgi:hypothetical protein